LRRTLLLQEPQVPAVHGYDEVEPLEVRCAHLARALCAQVVTPPSRMVLRALIRRLPDMPVAGARRLDMNIHADLLRKVAQHPLRRRRSADIAGADEKHAGPCPGKTSPLIHLAFPKKGPDKFSRARGVPGARGG
jgi:hypothetical protein